MMILGGRRRRRGDGKEKQNERFQTPNRHLQLEMRRGRSPKKVHKNEPERQFLSVLWVSRENWNSLDGWIKMCAVPYRQIGILRWRDGLATDFQTECRKGYHFHL